jgi:transcriptional regulator with XRE-family HTH domain
MSGQKESDPVAQYIGSRIRDKRKQQGWSQKGLAERIGLAFQQIQKYESGANRVNSITLYQIGQALGVPIGYFYQGLDGTEGDLCSQVSSLADGTDMMKSFIAIKNPQSRASLVAMARTLAGND